METLVFDVRGSFAHFRAYDTTRENITYPFPPRTALLGLIAAIMGKERNSYWGQHPLNKSLVSIQLLAPIQRTRIRINYVQTKSTMMIQGYKIILPKDPFELKSSNQRGYSAPVNLNVLRNVAYRIYFHSDDNELFSELKKRLIEKKYCYPPYLGHANMLAEVEYVGSFEAKELAAGVYEIDTVFPVDAVEVKELKLDELGYIILFNVPFELGYEDGRLYLKKAKNLVVNGAPNEEKVKAYFKENKVYSIEIGEKEYKVCFLENEP